MEEDNLLIREEETAYKSFRTYKNYLSSFYIFLLDEYGEQKDRFENLADFFNKNKSYKRINKVKKNELNEKEIRSYLNNAWNTEFIIYLQKRLSKDYIKYCNHWIAVQAYYSVYLALHALFIACKMLQKSKDHTALLRTTSDFINRRKLFPSPWNVCCSGCIDMKEHSYPNLPKNTLLYDFSNLSTPISDDFWNWYCMWLRTTRKKEFDRKASEWKLKHKNNKGQPRKRLRAEEKRNIYSNMHITTFFDCLYRLRIRSNYKDADAFIINEIDEYEAVDYFGSLLYITSSTLFIIESLIKKHIGNDNLDKLISNFLGRNKGLPKKYPLKLRKIVLSNFS